MDTGLNHTRKTAPKQAERPPLTNESESTIVVDGNAVNLLEIRATGDVILDVAFENSRSHAKLPTPQPGTPKPTVLMRNVKSSDSRALYRVKLETLKKNSKYFELLLGSETFEEGRRIAKTFGVLKGRGIAPSEAEPTDLPRVSITDDDDTTRIAGREAVFGDLLRILHGGDIVLRSTIPYLAILAVMADRFDCTAIVGKYVKASKKVPWPQTYGTVTTTVEETIRQKVLISWLLDDPLKFAAATKELVLRGSGRWVSEEPLSKDQQAVWWDLQDGLETELQYRRSGILNTISSLQKHFLNLYSSKTRQCKQFYDTSAACDSYSLGEMVKFFMSKGLLSLASPLSANYDDYPEAYSGDIENLITILRQCPNYQIDANHNHCGLRSRILPCLDFIQSMLTSNIGIDRRGWKTDRPVTSWETNTEGAPFTFTRTIATDQRLKMDGFIVGNKHAKALFMASSWNWSPEGGDVQVPRLGRAFGSMSGL